MIFGQDKQVTRKDKERNRREIRTLQTGTAQDTGYETIEQAGNNNIRQDTGDNNIGHDSTGKAKGPEHFRGVVNRKRQERTTVLQ